MKLSASEFQQQFLLSCFAGSEFAAAIMPWRKYGPIALPESDDGRAELVRAHLAGAPAMITFAPLGKSRKRLRSESLQLGAYLPSPDGRCNFIAVDLDGASHGAGALADPDRAVRCVVEATASSGLLDGVIVVTSRSGTGRHCWVIPPEPVSLSDACITVAFLALRAFRIADQASVESDSSHAFLALDGSVASPGQSGAFELLPRSDVCPVRGWILALPFGGHAAERGGGVLIDVSSGPVTSIELRAVPKCRAQAWCDFVNVARKELGRRSARRAAPSARPRNRRHKLDPRTVRLLEGSIPVGGRNRAVFYGVRDLLFTGMPLSDAVRAVADGGRKCGLSEAEVNATIRSALRVCGGVS